MGICKRVRGARKRGVELFWAFNCQEALGTGSSVALKDKEANALRNLARLTSLVGLLGRWSVGWLVGWLVS